jgi:hypothetical protein
MSITFKDFQFSDRAVFDKPCLVREPLNKLAVVLEETVMFAVPSPQVIFLQIDMFLTDSRRHLVDYYALMFPNVTQLVLTDFAIDDADWDEIFAGFGNLESIVVNNSSEEFAMVHFSDLISINRNRTKSVEEIVGFICPHKFICEDLPYPSKLHLNLPERFAIPELSSLIKVCVGKVKDLKISGIDISTVRDLSERLSKFRRDCEKGKIEFLPEVLHGDVIAFLFGKLVKRNINKSAQLSILSE